MGKIVEMQEVLNKEIILLAFKKVPSKYPKKTHPYRLDIQIEFEGEIRLLWSTSNVLIEMIEQFPLNKFPIRIKIIKEKESKRLVFTKV